MKRVLVVDDDFMVASIHRQYVERVGGFVVVGEAHSGAQALELVAELKPDLLLLDIYLPDMSGLDVMRQVRADSAVDVVAITAARDVETLRAAMRYGAIHISSSRSRFPPCARSSGATPRGRPRSIGPRSRGRPRSTASWACCAATPACGRSRRVCARRRWD